MAATTEVAPGLRGLPAGLPYHQPVDRKVFPDGLRTSGQHPPVESQLRPFEAFPTEITGPTIWEGSVISKRQEEWVHVWSENELNELLQAVDAFTISGIPLININKVHTLPFHSYPSSSASFSSLTSSLLFSFQPSYAPLPSVRQDANIIQFNFHIPNISRTLHVARNDILNGRGFVLFRGLPVDKWGRQKAAIAMMGVSAHLGYLLSQNKLGQLLGHVTNLDADWKNSLDKVKIAATNAAYVSLSLFSPNTIKENSQQLTHISQLHHTDEADIVGLLFCAPGETGGASGCASAHTVWNALMKERPDVAKTLASPIWYFDRKGEITAGQEPWIKVPVFYLEPGGQERVYVK